MQAIKAQRGNRTLTGGQPDDPATLRQRRVALANPVLLLFRRLIDIAVAEAKKTRYGLPTDMALLQRWWINDDRPPRGNRSKLGRMQYAGSFECCCEMLGLDVNEERKRVLAEIDDANVQAMVRHAGEVSYQRRAAVLRCAGIPVAVGRQYVLGLVDVREYEEVAEPTEVKSLARAIKRENRERTAQSSKRRKRLKPPVAGGSMAKGLSAAPASANGSSLGLGKRG